MLGSLAHFLRHGCFIIKFFFFCFCKLKSSHSISFMFCTVSFATPFFRAVPLVRTNAHLPSPSRGRWRADLCGLHSAAPHHPTPQNPPLPRDTHHPGCRPRRGRGLPGKPTPPRGAVRPRLPSAAPGPSPRRGGVRSPAGERGGPDRVVSLRSSDGAGARRRAGGRSRFLGP